jgi:hypothetical protein
MTYPFTEGWKSIQSRIRKGRFDQGPFDHAEVMPAE